MERIISLLPREVDEGAFLRRRQLHRISRTVSRLYFLGRLQDEQFDSYPQLGPALCRKITTDLNSILREGGSIAIIDSPTRSLTSLRLQILTHQAYLRVVNPTALLPNTEEIIDGPVISTRLTRSAENADKGTVDFDVRKNYGRDRVFLLSEQRPRDGLAITVSQHGNTFLLLDKDLHLYSKSPKWRINSRFFA